MYTYRLLEPDEYHLAPREVLGSDQFTPENCRILAAIDENGEVVATWTIYTMYHLEPFWVRQDHRGSRVLMRRMAEAMTTLLKGAGIPSAYSVVLDSTPVLAKFARFFGAKPVDGKLYYWEAPKE